MSIQSVNNKVSFASENNYSERAKAFINMDDQGLMQLAAVHAHQSVKKTDHNKVTTYAFASLPIVGALTAFALHKGSIGSKTTRGLLEGASWGLPLLVAGAYSGIRNFITSKSESLKEFTKDHPGLTLAADIGALVGIYFAGRRGLIKGISYFKNNFKGSVKEFNGFVGKMESKLDGTFLNKKVLPKVSEKVEKFTSKHPTLASITKDVAAYSPLIAMFGILFGGGNSRSEYRKQAKENFNQLKNIQLQTAKHLANEADVKCEILKNTSAIGEETCEVFS